MSVSNVTRGDLIFPVYEFRPLPDVLPYEEVLRYADGAWIPDDGEYDLAFVTRGFCVYVSVPYQRNILWKWLTCHWTKNIAAHPRGNPWHYMLRDGASEWGGDWGRSNHPNERAADLGVTKACRVGGGCGNGRPIEFDLRDRHMLAGLVRVRDTGAVVVPPAEPRCCYCGLDWLPGVPK